MKTRKILKVSGISLLTLIGLVFLLMIVSGKSLIVLGMHDPIVTTHNVAIDGYDVMAYHNQQKSSRGSDAFVMEWMGAQWHFESLENKETFESDPEKYAPAFGGHCAFACSKGVAAPGAPESFAVINDQLYLYAEDQFRDEFAQDSEQLIEDGLSNWK